MLLLLLSALNDPFHDGVGGLKPVAMERSLDLIDQALSAIDADVELPCDERGQAGLDDGRRPRGRDRVELVATLLLALATVATAWSGYQSTRWNGEQAKAAARANALRIESAKEAGLANTQTGIDVATFTQWVERLRTGGDRARGLLLQALPAGVPTGRRRVGGHHAAQESGCAAHTVRDAGVPVRGAAPRRSS